MGTDYPQHYSPVRSRSVIFLDRDGVINEKRPADQYVRSVEEFQFLSGAVEGLARLRSLGFGLVVVTNQRGIARGFMTSEELEEVHAFMNRELARNGVQLDGIYVCPHEVNEDCPCRKPKPGLILTATRELEVDPARSYMVGDSASDIEAGKRAGARTVRIGREDESGADMVFPSLLDFAVFMEAHDGGTRTPWPYTKETKGAE